MHNRLTRLKRAMREMKTNLDKKTSLYINNLGRIFDGKEGTVTLGKDEITFKSRRFDWFVARNLLKTPSNVNEGYSLHIFKAEGNLAWKHKKRVEKTIKNLEKTWDLKFISMMSKAELETFIEKCFLIPFPELASKSKNPYEVADEKRNAIDALSQHLTSLSLGKIFDSYLHSNPDFANIYNNYQQAETKENLNVLIEDIFTHFPWINPRLPQVGLEKNASDGEKKEIDPEKNKQEMEKQINEKRTKRAKALIRTYLLEWHKWKKNHPNKPYHRDFISVNTRYGDAATTISSSAAPAPSSRKRPEVKPNSSPQSHHHTDKPSPRTASPADEKEKRSLPNPRRSTLEKPLNTFSPGDFKSGVSPKTSRNTQLSQSDDEKVRHSPRSRIQLDPRDLPEISRLGSISVSTLPVATIEIKKQNVPPMPRWGNVLTKNPLFWTDSVVEGIVQSVFALLSEFGDSKLVLGAKIVVAIPLMPTLIITNGVTRGTTGLFEALKKGIKLLGRYIAEKCASDEEVQPFECVAEEADKPLTPPSPAPEVKSTHAGVALSLQIDKVSVDRVSAKSEGVLMEHDPTLPNVPFSEDNRPLTRVDRLHKLQHHRLLKSSLGDVKLDGIVKTPDGLTLQLAMVPKS